MPQLDVLVAGGGPAGLVTALHARRAGLSVAVVEPRTAPVDKACGEGLMPPAVAALNRLGVEVAGRAFRGIAYCDASHRVTANFRTGDGRGVQRTVLHSQLHQAAVAAGVQVVHGRVDGVAQDSSSVTAAGLRARYLVGADGLHSPLRRTLGLDRPARSMPRWGIRAHFACAPWTDRVEVHWAAGGEAYVTPVSEDCVGVAVLGGAHAPFAQRLEQFPALAARLPAVSLDRPRAAGPLRQCASTPVAGRVLLVGDAAGYVDALTGEGMAIAFTCAEALVRRIVEDRPQAYAGDHRRLTRTYRAITHTLLAAARFGPARRRIVPAASAAPLLFQAVVSRLAQ